MNPMSRSIRLTAMLLLVGYLAVAIGLGYWQVLAAPELVADPLLNAHRIAVSGRFIQRGRILDRNGVELARSERDSSGFRRAYPYPWVSHVVGYYSLTYGTAGIEGALDDHLAGRVGIDPLRVFLNRLLLQPVVGDDVYLTLDIGLQEVAYRALGESRGAVVVLDPRSGAILALASYPYFAPGRLDEDWQHLLDDPERPLINRATQGLYPPGSTFKTVTLAAALDQGVYTPDSQFNCPGRLPISGFVFTCVNHPPGEYSLARAYSDSCNIAFARIGLRLGADSLSEYAHRFGFESEVPLEIPTETSYVSVSPGFLRDEVALAATAFGQGELLATPLQMALLAAAVANDGMMLKPHLVQEVESQTGVVRVASEEHWRSPIRSDTAQQITALMVQAVEEGWGSEATIPGVRVAGKTGTAEVGPDREPHAWFIGFAPADQPEVVVVVVKEHGGKGSQVAAPAARLLLEHALGRY